MQGTPDYAQAKTFQIGVGGGGGGRSSFGPSGYAAAYLEGQGIMEMLDWEDKRRRQAQEEEYAAQRSEFARNAELRAQRDQQLQEMAAIEAAKKAREQEQREFLKSQRAQELDDDFQKVTSLLAILNPLDKDADKKINDINQSNEYLSLITDRNLRPAAMEAFNSKLEAVQEVRSGLQQIAKDQYGVDAFDFDSVPSNKKGQIDYRGFHSMMQQQADEMKRRAEQEVEQYQAPAGYIPEIATDPYGRPFVKGKIKAPMTPEEEEDKVAKKLQLDEYLALIRKESPNPRMRPLSVIKAELRKSREAQQEAPAESPAESLSPQAQTPSQTTAASATNTPDIVGVYDRKTGKVTYQ